ncbi:MAG: ACT domain-containing protein [Clostridia bacterium]|nr:ACT domain-containing protein [Clostridia bacterium]
MKIKIIDGEFSVLKVENFKDVKFDREFCFACKSDKEFSLVVKTCDAPSDCLKREDGWRAMVIDGELDFALIGILAKISDALANKGVALFAVSTFDTDYVLVKSRKLKTAVTALEEIGFEIY